MPDIFDRLASGKQSTAGKPDIFDRISNLPVQPGVVPKPVGFSLGTPPPASVLAAQVAKPAQPSEPMEIQPYNRKVEGVLPGVGPQTLKKVAMQSRTLLPEEKMILKAAFGDSIDPNAVRVAYDDSAGGSTLRGYVFAKGLPTVVFMANDDRGLSSDLVHEVAHVWQHLSNAPRYRFPMGSESHAYEYNAASLGRGSNFEDLGLEQQPSAIADRNPVALDYVRQHPGRRLPTDVGNMAFLDSVRSAYGGKDTDAAARKGSETGLATYDAIGRPQYQPLQQLDESSATQASKPPASKLAAMIQQ